MSDDVVTDLTRRLERLERRHRLLMRTGAALLVLVAGAALLGQAAPRRPPRIVEAERYVLRDAAGAPRAWLGVAPDGAVGLELLDGARVVRTALLLRSDGVAALRLNDKNGHSRSLLSVGSEETHGLEFIDRDRRVRAQVGLRPDGSPGMVMLDSALKVLWKAP
jgi:hypothetical protein